MSAHLLSFTRWQVSARVQRQQCLNSCAVHWGLTFPWVRTLPACQACGGVHSGQCVPPQAWHAGSVRTQANAFLSHSTNGRGTP
jgi:hypothetical protein